MTALILLAMFSFVVLPTISGAMRQGSGMSDPVLAELDGVKLTASRVETFTQNHYRTVQFLRRLAQESIKRGSTPQVPGFNINPQTGDIQGIGISTVPSDELSIRTLQFAAEAERKGFELDDTSIELWLEQFTGGTISQSDVFRLLRKETGNRMGQPQLFDMLRKQLLSALYFRGSGATISNNSMAGGQAQTLSPLDHWRNFLKLNQNASIQAYGVLVSDYIGETDDTPSQAEIEETYEEGKDRYPSRESADPGFRRRPTASFEYLMGELQKFRDIELAKLPEEAIRAEYERRLQGGDFVLPDLQPPAAPMDETGADPDLEQVEAFAKELEQAGNLEEPMTEDGEPETDTPESSDSGPESTGPETETPQTTQPENADPGTPEPETSEPETGGTGAESTEASEAGDGGGAADESDQSSSQLPAAIRLVSQNGDETNPSESDPEPQETAEAGDEQDQNSTPETGEESTENPSPAVDTEPAETQPADAESSEAAMESSDDDSAESPQAAEPKVLSFEEVKDQIARDMVEETARAAMDKAITAARNQMQTYYRKVAISTGKEEVKRPDLESIATEQGLTYRSIGPHDPVSVADEPIASAFQEGTEFSQRGMPFTAMMYGVEGQITEQPLFRPVVFVQLETKRSYLCWKTEATEAFTPSLEEVREEVIDSIRLVEARALAVKAAEEIAEKANGGEKLDSLVPESKKTNFKKDIKPFTWLNTVGFSGISIGNVEELDSVGEDFMKAVFDDVDQKHVVATNLPGRVVYVIKRIEMQPTASDLRSIFKQPTERLLPQFMTDGSMQKVQQGFYEAVDERTGFEYLGIPGQ
ncbi:MAG: hypothetical protein AAFU85_03870 [Planctomycetota bacterium]